MTTVVHRLIRGSTCSFDYAMRLCSWDGGDRDIQDAEIRIQGIHKQLENRTYALIQFLPVIQALVGTIKNSSLYEDQSEHLAEIYSSIILSITHAMLSFATISLLAYKVCRDVSGVKICLKLFNDFLPILMKTVADKAINQLFLQTHLDLLATTLVEATTPSMLPHYLVEPPRALASLSLASFDDTSLFPSIYATNDEAATSFANATAVDEDSLLAYTLGEEFVKQTQRFYWNVPFNIQGVDAVVFFESAFRSYVVIFQLVIALGIDNDFLVKCGLDIVKLLNAISTSLAGFSDWMQTLGCCVTNVHSIVSLAGLIEAGRIAFNR